MRTEADVLELLRELVVLRDLHEGEGKEKDEKSLLSEWEIEAFPSMLDQVEGGKPLTPKQMEKVLGAADRLKLHKRSQNLFSNLPESRQKAERKRAAAVVLPWEKGLMARPLRPPGR